MKRITTIILAALTAISVSAQQDIIKQLDNYFKGYRTTGQRIRSNAHLQSLEINDSAPQDSASVQMPIYRVLRSTTRCAPLKSVPIRIWERSVSPPMQ